jgi:chaperonin GroEL
MARMLEGAAAEAALLRGMERMTCLLRPTLGPLPRRVAIAPIMSRQPPEMLDNAATIARRMVQLPDHFEDMGAMMVRHMVWRVFEQVGDGTASAAVLASCLARAALRYTRFGGNPVGVNRGIRRGLDVVRAALQASARPIETPSEIAGVVHAVLGNRELAETIAEAVDSVGIDGTILVEEAQGTETTLDYAEGLRWNEGYVSPYFTQDSTALVRLTNPRILVTDHVLESAQQLVPVLELCVQMGERRLFVVAPEIRDSAVALLLVNRERGVLDTAVGVRAPASGDQRTRILEDIALLTGGRCISHTRGDRLAEIAPDDLGKARQAWATPHAFGIVGGLGDRSVVRQRIAAARAQLQGTEDEPVRRTIEERIGRLAGVTATIHVGAHTPAERADLKLRIECAVKAARLALRDGVVGGGGAALVNCIPLLEVVHVNGDEMVGVKALARALGEPMRTIVSNAGFEPGAIVCESRQRKDSEVFDVVRREWVDPWQTGLLDPLAVVLMALECGVSLATMALTADVLVHREHAPRAIKA